MGPVGVACETSKTDRGAGYHEVTHCASLVVVQMAEDEPSIGCEVQAQVAPPSVGVILKGRDHAVDRRVQLVPLYCLQIKAVVTWEAEPGVQSGVDAELLKYAGVCP